MKSILLAILIVSALAQSQVLTSSGDKIATASTSAQATSNSLPVSSMQTSFSGAQPTEPSSLDFLDLNSLGSNEKWVFPTPVRVVYPLKYLTTYTIVFTTDCPKNDLILELSATGSFFVMVNGKLRSSWGVPYPNTDRLTISASDLTCGCNTIKVIVYNNFFASPLGLIYSLSQDKTGCYVCQNTGDAYYNRDSCQCECSFGANCKAANPLKVWRDYPTCGCRCAALGLCSQKFYWNDKSCSCECKHKCCPAGYVLDKKTCNCISLCQNLRGTCKSNEWFDDANCKCVPKCVPFAPCPAGKEWNFRSCRCQCSNVHNCAPAQRWDESTCSCKCQTNGLCAAIKRWNTQTCQCECPSVRICPSNKRWNSNTCQCECSSTNFCIAIKTWNSNTCECECPSVRRCPSNQVWNPNTCQCQCRLQPNCIAIKRWNSNTCKCECPAVRQCPLAQVWNSNTCQCQCPQKQQLCTGVKSWNNATCQCECPRKMCRSNEIYNTSICACQCATQKVCVSTKTWNPQSCDCECTVVAKCNAWQRWNSKSCSCDCLGSVSSCNSVQKWNVTACSCDCLALPRCVGGSLFNRTTCRCSASASNFLSSTIDTSIRQLP